MTYIRTTQGKDEFSSCQTIQLIYDHEELIAGQWVSNPDAELIAAEDWVEFVPPVIPPQPRTEPSEREKIQALSRLNLDKVVALDDSAAVMVKALFPTWISYLEKQEQKSPAEPDVFIYAGDRVYYDDELWKALTTHTPQRSWNPRDAHSLFVMITIEDGSLEHPIRFSQGMVLEQGKYYTQYDVKYQCIRSSEGMGFYANLADVVGNYVMVVNG